MERNPMSLYFRPSVGLGRLVRLNLSKSGLNLSAGTGCTLNFDRNGIRSKVGVPATGLSYSSNLTPRQHAHVQQGAVVAQPTAAEERLRWQAVALEIAEGLCKAVLLIGSIVAGIVLGIVVAAMSSQL